MKIKKRFIGTNNGATGRQAPSALSSKGSGNNPGFVQPPGEKEGARQETPQERRILEIFLNPNFYKGQRVVVTGMILRDDELKPHFGGRDTA